MLSLVVARARNGAIGKDNAIPWDVPEDLKLFQRETVGGAIIMGRNTWDSLPVKPLGRRLNIVVSSQDLSIEAEVVTSVDAAIALAQQAGYPRIYGIGGAGIYRDMLPLADRLLITEVETDIPDADAYFPEFDPDNWTLLHRHALRDAAPKAVMHEYLRKGL